jgi:hypothetical protein
LSTPAGRVFLSQHHSYQAAVAALVQADDDRHHAAFRFNNDRMASGLPALGRDQALAAVTPSGGLTLSGGTVEICEELSSRDPWWHWGFASEPGPPVPARVIS